MRRPGRCGRARLLQRCCGRRLAPAERPPVTLHSGASTRCSARSTGIELPLLRSEQRRSNDCVQACPSAKWFDYGRRNQPIASTNIDRTLGRLEWVRGSGPFRCSGPTNSVQGVRVGSPQCPLAAAPAHRSIPIQDAEDLFTSSSLRRSSATMVSLCRRVLSGQNPVCSLRSLARRASTPLDRKGSS
jgi:hypothetical protein